MRRMIAGPAVLALLVAFWGSPFFHLHTATGDEHHHSEAEEHHHEALIHVHLPATVTTHSGAAVTETEEEEKHIDIFTAVPPTGAAVTLPLMIPARTVLEPPVVAVASVFLPLWPRTHDPPSLSLLVPRAPPA